jgi:hypothetical protein
MDNNVLPPLPIPKLQLLTQQLARPDRRPSSTFGLFGLFRERSARAERLNNLRVVEPLRYTVTQTPIFVDGMDGTEQDIASGV